MAGLSVIMWEHFEMARHSLQSTFHGNRIFEELLKQPKS